MSDKPALEVRDLVTSFALEGGNRLRAVDGVSFSVLPGEILGIVGESGSGKSVTAFSILRLLASNGRTDEGEVLLDGVNVLDLPEQEMRHVRGSQIGLVFQNPMTALNPSFTVGWQFREALRAHGDPDGEDLGRARARVSAALASVGLPDPERQFDSFPHQMSGGMRQRAVIALAMLHDPRVLIADEPTTALDVTVQAQILRLMKQLVAEHQTALLLITHNMGVVARMCDRVAVMYAGEVVEEAPAEELFANPRHPYTWALLRSIPRADHSRGTLPALAGLPPDMSNPPQGCRFAPRCPLARPECGSHPQLVEITERHKVRCWVTQDGQSAEHHMSQLQGQGA